jgi:Redoxin
MKIGDALPDLSALDIRWLDGLTPPDLAGRAVLIHCWSSGCALCHEGVADIRRWRERYERLGLTVVAVWQPRNGETVDIDDVSRDARTSMRIDYSCAIDAGGSLVARFGNTYAPGYFVFDRAHALRHRQMGNGGFDRIDELLTDLFEERKR